MLSQKTRYAIRAMQHLADRHGEGPGAGPPSWRPDIQGEADLRGVPFDVVASEIVSNQSIERLIALVA